MATYFLYSHKVKECLHELNRIKDNNLFKSLERLLEEPTFTNGQTIKAELLEMVGDNPNYGFMHELFSKCSSNIFSSEHVQCILDYCFSDEDRLKDSSEKLLNSYYFIYLNKAIIRNPLSVLIAMEKQIPSMPKNLETQAQ
ncbi:hypothetical protein TSUD_227870 [Trifolium subterraneum]|uniref:Uncharacterized protein n=1 Tax=Trifolium subterraneum TaxID=3900 RepID=A0A2Z6LSN4_TRISU|nr:hypothetical protein TSUD_227870 [Trifolium subterraneum]